MNFELTEEQKMTRNMVREFATNVISPKAIEVDIKAEFPVDTFKQMGELGLMGIPFSEEYGGSGSDTISYAIAVEEVGEACGRTGRSYAANVSPGASPSSYFGTAEPKKQHF